jgi:sulfur dioxygenase
VLVDVRTDAEREWVGFVPRRHRAGLETVAGHGDESGIFDAAFAGADRWTRKLVLLCRSGVRSIAAAKTRHRARPAGLQHSGRL